MPLPGKKSDITLEDALKELNSFSLGSDFDYKKYLTPEERERVSNTDLMSIAQVDSFKKLAQVRFMAERTGLDLKAAEAKTDLIPDWTTGESAIGPPGLDCGHLLPLHLAATQTTCRPWRPVQQPAAPWRRCRGSGPWPYREGHGQVFPCIQPHRT